MGPRELNAAARVLAAHRALPPRVAVLGLRARGRAWRTRDGFSPAAAARPRELAELLRLGAGARTVVEIGTATGWTTAALARGLPGARVTSYDPVVRPGRAGYLGLLPAEARGRIRCVAAGGEAGPLAGEDAVDLLFVDGGHEREETLATVRAWRDALRPGGAVAFHDYGPGPGGAPPHYPGVAEAVAELGLEGELRGDLFVWRR